jgi:hypothetical protein
MKTIFYIFGRKYKQINVELPSFKENVVGIEKAGSNK